MSTRSDDLAIDPKDDPRNQGAATTKSGGQSPTKAYLELIELEGSDGSGGTSTPKRINFQFNPKEFTVTKAANWKETTGRRRRVATQYLGPSPASMTLELFLDGSATGEDVSKQVRELTEACVPTDKSTSKNRPLPPGVRFGWDQVYFEGYLVKVSATYQLFRRNGTPVRALCSLELKEFNPKVARQNPTSGSLSNQGSHRVVEGDSLSSIAYQEYGDPTRWRRIAQINGIDDPMALQPGTRLLIPPAPSADPRR